MEEGTRTQTQERLVGWSAVVRGHRGIEEEDRALSCLSVYVLCSRNLPNCVGAFAFERFLSTYRLAYSSCLVVGVQQL